ncbi:MAG TPA: cyclic nucleotide-binding domain-containing protein [Candidatus Binataceae bacterium]|nr:cyclic nucleotide-binding domain-containing protein [Candidatus Binataceae bacterium]
MSSIPPVERPPQWLLWQRLSQLEIFKGFTDDQRDSFLHAYEQEPAIKLRHFKAGDVVCRKGEYELDLCFVLEGSVDLFDELPHGRLHVATLPAGRFYGELGAIGGLPRTLDIIAAADTAIFYIPRHALKYLEINSAARALLADRYREMAVTVTVGNLELFRGVPAHIISELTPKCEILRHELRGVPIVTQGEPGDALYIVRDGFVQVVRQRDDGTHRVTAYLRSGDFFGEMALFGDGVRWASVLTAGKCELIKIRREDFLELCRRFPTVEAEARKVIVRRQEQDRTVTRELSELLEKSGQLGVIQADALLVMDLDLCIKCDNCVKACEELHGQSRLIRNGIQLGKYLVPSACRHCDDPKCMNSCPTGAIKRRPEGEIYFQYDMCIGCGNCAIACPYDNIAMIDTPTFDRAQARKTRLMNDPNFFRPYPIASHDVEDSWFRRLFRRGERGASKRKPAALPQGGEHSHVPVAFPIKCDLCDGLPFMGCVHSCPTGAAIRIDPAELFDETGAISAGSRVRKARGGSD